MLDDRFNIGFFLGGAISGVDHVEKSGDGLRSLDFQELVSKCQVGLQKHCDKDLQKLLKNKSVAMLYLDKTENLVGKFNTDSIKVKKYMGGYEIFALSEFIWQLAKLKNQPSLSEYEIKRIEDWIVGERTSIPISLILNAWRYIGDGSIVSQIESSIQKIEPPKEEIEIFINSLANEVKSMQFGDQLNVPAGTLGHSVRIKIKKNRDGTIELIYFNTGLGTPLINGYSCTACRYASIPSKKLETPHFWKRLVEVKMQRDMNQLNNLLGTLGTPESIDKWLKKTFQESGSCIFKAVGAEFKYSFITSFPTIEEGWKAYKRCTALMVLQANSDASLLEPSIRRLLSVKQAIRQRYLDWSSIIDKPDKLTLVIDAYIEAIVSIDQYSRENCQLSIKKLPSLMALSLLDKRLNEYLNRVPFEKLNQIREVYGSKVTFNGVNHLGYKQFIWIESTTTLLKNIVKFTDQKRMMYSKIQELTLAHCFKVFNKEPYYVTEEQLRKVLVEDFKRKDSQIRRLSLAFFSDQLTAEFREALNFPRVRENDLKELMKEYLLRGDPIITNQIKDELLNRGIISKV